MADKIEVDEGENWVFDSLVNFLHGNIWKIPVLGFVEEKSVVFDPDSYSNLSEDKEEEFRKIHEEYKALVDFMLSSFMEDLQVTPEQVEEACQIREKQQTNLSESHITKVALEQLQAAEDFSVFRRIMTRKNIDLQLQSLELLVSKYGVLSPSLRSDGSTESTEDTGEEDFLQVVIRYCDNSLLALGETDSCAKSINLSQTLHKALDKTKTSKQREQVEDNSSHENQDNYLTSQPQPLPSDTQETQIDNPSLLSQNPFYAPPSPSSKSQLIQQDLVDAENLSQLLDDAATLRDEKTTPAPATAARPTTAPKSLPPVKSSKKDAKKTVKFDETTVAEIAPEQHRILTSVRKALDVDADMDDTGRASSMSTKGEGSDEEIQKRREYLMAQRDKLVAMKKKEREKQLQGEGSGAGGHPARPKSARAAQMALRAPPSGAGGDKSLAARRALAARLKQELLDN